MVWLLLKLVDIITLRALIVPDSYSGICRCNLNMPETFRCEHPQCRRDPTKGKRFIEQYRAGQEKAALLKLNQKG